MPAPIALAYLATLSADLRAAVVLDAGGAILAGDAALEPHVARLLAGAPPDAARQTPYGDGALFAARSGAHALGVAMGPQALEAVVIHDLLATLDDLRGW
ncbi:hypothetical protein NBH00_12380 [Paraconexibacter antarcticus]|uniref:Roadblock/LC7 domain-containing protein n=1 Tax=Paraconexibacter antarcticus TaxID=2949664 RepID=A0ABY5E0F8_9ACTN|nr:hypothetical protein [Paraconexibacter antarcticus]UTI66976.1 hypothetical protein NBH00_12380 [Paraconexibacter antarcticus]